ncbi:hypothetical protein ACROYT_G022146 [Oculina patagonica]
MHPLQCPKVVRIRRTLFSYCNQIDNVLERTYVHDTRDGLVNIFSWQLAVSHATSQWTMFLPRKKRMLPHDCSNQHVYRLS